MKRVILLLAMLMTGMMVSHAQTQRMVLYEGFSNASCPPCAAQNPAINTLVAANPTKLVAVKYQTNWPGVDPMNAQTQTWVGPRVTYYSITGVPATRVDGTGTSLTQAVIDSRYAVASPFSLSISHTFNAAGDTVQVQCVVTAAQNYTGSSLVLHVAMVEKHIPFASAPGTNGETNFYHVMRRMLPSATGTALQDTWVDAASQTFGFTAAVPAYIYDLNQLAFIAFIQSNTNKAVLQAAKNDPIPFALYPRVASHNIPPEPTCNQNLDLQLGVKNMGTATIDSFTVEYGVVGEPANYYTWTGTLATGQQTMITLPTLTFSSSSPIVYMEVKNPNGSAAYPKLHARVQQAVNYISTYNAIPVSQTFTPATFPPPAWVVLSDDDLTWVRHTAGGFGGSPGGSAMMNFYNSPSGKIDYLYMEPLDLTGGNLALLSFSVAHARYDNTYGTNDRLQVEVSTNCGQSWSSVYLKAGVTLSTAPNTTASFVPSASQWRSDTVNLSAYVNQTEVLVRFKAISGYGNNLYVDDIQLLSPDVGISRHESRIVASAYPNPTRETLNLDFILEQAGDVLIQVFDNQGKIVYTHYLGRTSSGHHVTRLDASAWAPGLYHITLTSGDQQVVQKVVR